VGVLGAGYPGKFRVGGKREENLESF
jgi:hypothetical protein